MHDLNIYEDKVSEKNKAKYISRVRKIIPTVNIRYVYCFIYKLPIKVHPVC